MARNPLYCWIIPRRVNWRDVARIAAEAAILIAVGTFIWAMVWHDQQEQKRAEQVLTEWEAANAQNMAKCSSASYPYCTYDKRGDRIAGCEEAEPPVAECEFRPAGRPDVEGKVSKTNEIINLMLIAASCVLLLFAVVAAEIYHCWGDEDAPGGAAGQKV